MSRDPADRIRSTDRPSGGGGAPAEPLGLVVPTALIEEIAARAVETVLERLGTDATLRSPYLTVVEAAEYLRSKRQRVYDLLSARRLTRFKDGRRTLLSRQELDAYLAGESRPVAPVLPLPPQSLTEKQLAA
jgi:excisionase family DNA binding protein